MKLSFPQTRKRRSNVSGVERPAGTYVQCLDCAKELEYDWRAMKIVHGQKKVKVREQEA